MLPPPPAGAKAWIGSDLATRPEAWTRRLSPEQIEELTRAAEDRSDSDLADLGLGVLESIPLRTLADKIRTDLIDGMGFTLLRGLPIDDLGPRAGAIAFLVLGRLVGSLRSQNAAGHLLGHVRDVGADPADGDTRYYQTSARQTFHTDSADAVALLCVRPARSGGRSLLASAETVYRLVLERRPDLAARLFDPIATDRRGEQPPGEQPWFDIPVLSWFGGRLTVQYQRQYIDSAARFPEAPRADPQHVAALDMFDEVVNEPGVSLAMDLEPGDIQFVYNHSLLHDRTGFVDFEDAERRRHLLRLWLALPGDRELPPVFAQRYGSVEIGDRGGIAVEGTRPCVSLAELVSPR